MRSSNVPGQGPAFEVITADTSFSDASAPDSRGAAVNAVSFQLPQPARSYECGCVRPTCMQLSLTLSIVSRPCSCTVDGGSRRGRQPSPCLGRACHRRGVCVHLARDPRDAGWRSVCRDHGGRRVVGADASGRNLHHVHPRTRRRYIPVLFVRRHGACLHNALPYAPHNTRHLLPRARLQNALSRGAKRRAGPTRAGSNVRCTPLGPLVADVDQDWRHVNGHIQRTQSRRPRAVISLRPPRGLHCT